MHTRDSFIMHSYNVYIIANQLKNSTLNHLHGRVIKAYSDHSKYQIYVHHTLQSQELTYSIILLHLSRLWHPPRGRIHLRIFLMLVSVRTWWLML